MRIFQVNEQAVSVKKIIITNVKSNAGWRKRLLTNTSQLSNAKGSKPVTWSICAATSLGQNMTSHIVLTINAKE